MLQAWGMDRLVRSAYSVMVNSSSLRANSVPIRAIALSSASSACFVFIVGVRVQLIDVVARLQDAHRGDPGIALLDYIPRLPRSSFFVDHAVEEAIPPCQFRWGSIGVG